MSSDFLWKGAIAVAVVIACAVFAVAGRSGNEDQVPPPSAPDRDWPTWRGNAARTGFCAAALPDPMQLRWVRKGRTPAPAWPVSQHKIQFDVSFEPVVAGRRLFVPSMVADSVTAYDTDTGRELWRFYADGPVRMAPLAWRENLYVVSDDGFLYCLDAASGAAKWMRRCGPDERMVLGNDRLVSAWPVRGAPVLWEDPASGKATLYVGAGIWPFMGIFLHALDAETGEIVWTNSGSGSIYVLQQHTSPAFAGVAPQGYLAATEQHLLVAGGRTVPAVYDRKTGEFLYFHVSSRAFGNSAGGYDVSVVGDHFVNNGCIYRLSDGEPLVNLADSKLYPGILTTPVLGEVQADQELRVKPGLLAARVIDNSLIAVTDAGVNVYPPTPNRVEEMVKDRQGKERARISFVLPRPRTVPADWALKKVFFQAGQRLYGCGYGGLIGSVDLSESGGAGAPWTANVDGDVWTMIPGDGKLFAVTEQGAIYCFGEPSPEPAVVHGQPVGVERRAEHGRVAAGGYVMVWGLGEDAFDRLVELARDYHVIAVDPSEREVTALRRRLDNAGLYGTSVHLLVGEPTQMRFPPYLASRIEIGHGATSRPKHDDLVQKVFHCLRPYGGTAVFEGAAEDRAALQRAATAEALPNATLEARTENLELRREGALPKSAAWTHQYADVANTVVSRDELVAPPLGLLWFGGPSHEDILPRHGHGPSPQVIAGRLFIEGPHVLRAVDVYTGRLLWQRELKDLGKFYDNTAHQPGAGEIGGNYVSLVDGIYVVHDRKCLRLDPATGATIREFALPGSADHPSPHWGYIGVYEDLLIAGSTPLAIVPAKDKEAPPVVERNAQYASSSRELVVMNRHSGQVLWRRPAAQVFRHNAVVAGAGKIFCVDAISQANLDLLARRGEQPDKPPVLLALDIRTGEVLWQVTEEVFGTWLGYSAEHDLLLEAGSPARDRARDEVPAGMAACRGQDGRRIWQHDAKYAGTPMLHGSTIYTDGDAFELLTGKPLERTNPITGRKVDWRYARNYGCNTPIGGQHMLLFRSAAAGFYDLGADAGTGNWGGFKSGCTANLIPADGVLNAPDYTRTCTCSYQNQCSLALVPMPDVEVWTFQAYSEITGPLNRVGLNFGAPGDWPAPSGTLWLDYPSAGGKGPDLEVELTGESRYFRRHAADVRGQHRQVIASGVEGVETVRLPMNSDSKRKFTVRLYFSEPQASAGHRIFNVHVQDKQVLADLDVAAETGGPLRELVKEFSGVEVEQNLSISLLPAGNSTLPPVLCGIEAVAE
jgi:outer membrane protein assembly factor BamB